MNHDPLCGYDWVDPSDCQCCKEYAAVRADEREQARRRLASTLAHDAWCPLSESNSYPLADDVCCCGHEWCIAAVRGEA